ncbi:hypothetical protein J2X36_002724 [Methylobacterium sp. BE186]|uniref:DUF5906 domain-containing protein n=1 Tax=Methylobacterium sp. BE186 TaxID=2817715 RepID=UPI002859AC1F|nr:DUF5906 domain-containing protein [Methylobacterium sp. BE186]MDR7037969.1 hypothetical protein [Methylobacterium sp. BE186]
MNFHTESTLTFGDACRRFLDAGIPARALIPVAPPGARLAEQAGLGEKSLGKAPGRFDKSRGLWCGLKGNFTRVGVRDRADVEEFASFPTSNVGLLGRYAPAIDSDAETADARRFVDRLIVAAFGDGAGIAERVRGNGPRRLYSFRHAEIGADKSRIVRTRHIHYRLKGEEDHLPIHKLDIIGAGNQYVITGTHPSGDKYEWAKDWDLADIAQSGKWHRVENADICRFIEMFESELIKAGGTLIASTGGRVPREERDYSRDNPIMPVRDVFDGLQALPNDERNFPARDDFVAILAAIRAALGREAETSANQVEAWACEDPVWCPPDYFEKAWKSLAPGVRVDRHALDFEFRQRGIFVSARSAFPDDAGTAAVEITNRKSEQRTAETLLLHKVAARFLFGHVNMRTNNRELRIRSRRDVSREWRALDWWHYETMDRGIGLLQEIQKCPRWSSGKIGFWNFVRDLEQAHPENFYIGETRHPNYPRGEMVAQDNFDGTVLREVNMRHLSPVQVFAKRPAKDAGQAENDLRILLDFVSRVFGKLASYELDTLAYMAQTGRRPGNMLYLVGEQGVGKSIYTEMLISMFDGNGPEITSRVDGTKLINENSRRFVLAKVEGCRIISVKELPEGAGATKANMAAITSSLKQLVDPGPDGDFLLIEEKGKDSRPVHNFARVVTTSNYRDGLRIEEQDRRIFYVSCGITADMKPTPNFYEDLVAVTTDPERLAAFWRYLLSRDIAGYNVAAPPPVSLEKQEAQIAAMANPWERHLRAALIGLSYAGRWIFDLAEVAELMTAMAKNEHRNTNGAVDDRRDYDFHASGGQAQAALKRLARDASKIAAFKTGSIRLPVIYAFRSAADKLADLAGADRDDVLDALQRDRQAKPLGQDHPIELFSGPTKSKSFAPR